MPNPKRVHPLRVAPPEVAHHNERSANPYLFHADRNTGSSQRPRRRFRHVEALHFLPVIAIEERATASLELSPPDFSTVSVTSDAVTGGSISVVTNVR